jgi:hypothetical protein
MTDPAALPPRPAGTTQATGARPAGYRSKTASAWLAMLLGMLGLHRFYLHGLGDRWGWLFPLPTLLGLLGLQRLDSLGQDDRLAWMLIPLLGLSISVAMLSAIVYALTPDEKWDARFHGGERVTRTGWGAVLAAIFALMIGGGVLTGTIAYSIQMFFEWQLASGPPGDIG